MSINLTDVICVNLPFSDFLSQFMKKVISNSVREIVQGSRC